MILLIVFGALFVGVAMTWRLDRDRGIRAVIHAIALPFVLGGAIALIAAAVYWGLEALLVNYADHDRGLWEGAVLVVVMNGGNSRANRVLKRAASKEDVK